MSGTRHYVPIRLPRAIALIDLPPRQVQHDFIGHMTA
jgi:hypothetical protein